MSSFFDTLDRNLNDLIQKSTRWADKEAYISQSYEAFHQRNSAGTQEKMDWRGRWLLKWNWQTWGLTGFVSEEESDVISIFWDDSGETWFKRV